MQISALFTRHPCLFARVVEDPDSTRCLFEWLRQLGLDQKGVVRLVDRVPLLLQMDTERGGCMAAGPTFHECNTI